VIPPMTHPLSSAWKQPKASDILLDDEFAYMTEKTLNQLAEYSCSIPTGVYEGKMWKSGGNRAPWVLRWFVTSKKNPNSCSIEIRSIKIVDELWVDEDAKKE